MFSSPRPIVQLPESFQCASHAALTTPARMLSPVEVTDVVTRAVQHLGQRLTGTRFAISPSIAVGTTRMVLTVSAQDQNEAFVVKVAAKEILRHESNTQRTSLPSFQNDWVKRHIAIEEEVAFGGQRHVTVAPFVKGETLLAHATQRGLSEREWDIAYQTIPTLMRAIWRESRSPHDSRLGLLLDHHFDNIVVGVKQPPFHDAPRESTQRFVFVDGRDDGAYHSESALEDAVEDFRILFKRHAFVRNPWG